MSNRVCVFFSTPDGDAYVYPTDEHLFIYLFIFCVHFFQ